MVGGTQLTLFPDEKEQAVSVTEKSIVVPEHQRKPKCTHKEWMSNLPIKEERHEVQSTQFQYGVDYFVGDFVTVEHNRFGIRQNKIQLVGMIESFDRNGRNLTPTFKEA